MSVTRLDSHRQSADRWTPVRADNSELMSSLSPVHVVGSHGKFPALQACVWVCVLFLLGKALKMKLNLEERVLRLKGTSAASTAIIKQGGAK